MNEKNEIILFENQGVKLEVNLKDETVWLTQKQMAELFDKEYDQTFGKSEIPAQNVLDYKKLEIRASITISLGNPSSFSTHPSKALDFSTLKLKL